MFPASFYRVAAWLLLLGLSHGPLSAQTPAASRHRYWDARPDSLRQVLATQRADTARLRTLMHLVDVSLLVGNETNLKVEEIMETADLSARLHRPERRAYRLMATGKRLYNAHDVSRALDTLQAAVVAFDQQGRLASNLLYALRSVFGELRQLEAMRRYYQARLVYYQPRGAPESLAPCYLSLASYYGAQGNYNQALSYNLQALQCYRFFDGNTYNNQLATIGARYATWGNTAKALHYLQQSVAGLQRRHDDCFYAYKMMAEVYVQRHDYPAALRVLDKALVPPEHEYSSMASKKALVFTLRSAVLVAQGRPALAHPFLQAAQHLADSLHLPLLMAQGALQLDATWAGYEAAQGNAAGAEAHWLAAYRKARDAHSTQFRLAYLRALTRFYQQHGQSSPAARYAVAALALADSLEAREGALHVARYEIEQADRAQTARIAGLRQAQQQDVARARRQRWVLGAVLAVLALIGGFAFLLWRSNQLKQRANALLSEQKAEIQTQRDQTTQALTELRTTQAQLIQKEKMASLGELTAGIAHEIQNPLNFVNNFSEVSAELVAELEEEQLRPARDAALEAELLGDLKQNMAKITQHGQRAASIVKGMLEHSSSRAGEREATDLNRLCDEYLRLAYQGLRAKDKSFNAILNTDFLADLPLVTLVSTDVGRVLLNLFTNAFYAVRQRQLSGEPGYQPQVGVRTILLNQQVQIQVSDNGTGMSPAVQQKIFQPFFTTKPTGEGTGLGLSLSHDIIAQGHGGSLTVESEAGEGTAFTINLPV
ncbi:ATP-binding protein [Hymenobacter sp. BT770]|uniref:ATP-binding protein n=1 Tax=Hymenobacter sp. BT770 TaxID=2886942 RepID=UPI001D11808F|nr:ATP-binding protein [Hymenobacter sp. BT770]MCC3154590.1 histidine kinase [Hymenobacter sp. BT770]MDO3416644.1 ATP-binding protein [Hymenobacter sp. BT770]